MTVLAILQARMSSTRLPGKVLLPLAGAPMLQRQIERIQRAKSIVSLLVATSSDVGDDDIELVCRRIGVGCYRGSLNDVLDRFYQAASQMTPDHVVRLTGDCPLADPEVIDDVVTLHCRDGLDYTSNCHPPTFPDGLDVEVVRFSALAAAWAEAGLPSEREHVMPFIWSRKDRFRVGNHFNEAGDLSVLRWTVDEPEDYALVSQVYDALFPGNAAFGTPEVLQLLKRRPDLLNLNSRYVRNEGLAKSLMQDRAFQSVQGISGE